MCLLLSRKGGSPELNEAWLKDFFTKNDDGFGFMYALDGKLHVDKSLGKVGEFIDKWRQMEAAGYDFVCHLRMRTHGDISLENCHPYQVLDGSHGIEMWMAHNGVLSNGNAADITKSDTWHFIKDYLRPLLDPAVGGNPDLIYTPQFKAIHDTIPDRFNEEFNAAFFADRVAEAMAEEFEEAAFDTWKRIMEDA